MLELFEDIKDYKLRNKDDTWEIMTYCRSMASNPLPKPCFGLLPCVLAK